MQGAVLRGTQSGYELVLRQSASFDQIMTDLRDLLEKLRVAPESEAVTNFSLDVLTENRLLQPDEKKAIETLVSEYPKFQIHKFESGVMTKADANELRERETVHVLSRTIRNGQDLEYKGDILFLGIIHEGGKLKTNGNIYTMGNVHGILQAGFPDDESKVVIGDTHDAQQIHIGEQFTILDDDADQVNAQTVAYVNDLHALSFGKLANLKKINPKLFNQIGGL
ncbi:septum site-determining protein MinC [Levilactobacillus bambusae]|nr:septum site-determining protein MinC [Levilactobacillus bambusae]